ncbi:unnamed protein product [Prorocentrum cordatum]|uniref:Uncharacterized protein n=1 Tax=Prorocentrum cordatum TaxID=2364126 RepID=A0ABN9RBH3_9DINO|nr:unnamed protein product [Polarella glacialis]
MTQSTSDVELMNTPDGVTALVTATPFQYDDINEFYRRLEETHVSKVITARLQQIPGIKAACQSEPCNFTATAGPFLEAAQCSTSFLSEVPYEKSVPSLYCVGKTCADVCYPETTCGNVICGDAMKANNGSADTTCKGEDDCMDKCCVVMCSSWVCPKHTCDFRTEATEATPSEANETCCVMPEVECCRAGNAFCEACRECVNISEQCAQSPDDSACKPDEVPDCGMSVTSQFDTGTGKAVFSTAVIYGGSRAFSGGYGNASSGAEYRAWVWEIRTGETLMSFGTQTPVMVVAPSADGIHALTGEQSGTATAWNYVQGGPAFRTLLPDSSKSGPVVGIAGGFTYQTSYVTGGDFVEFWQWGPDRVGTFKAPNLLTEQQELQQRAETLKAVAVNMSDNPGLSAVGRKQLLEMASPEALSTTEQALKTGVLSLAKVTAVVQLPGNSNFASGDANGVIRYFNYRTLTVLQEIHGHAGKVTAFSAFATGTRLLSGGEDGKIILWNIATGEIMRTWTQPFGGAVRTLQQVRHGTAFLAGSDDGFIRRYELNGGEDFASAACRQAVGGGAVYDIAANNGNPSQIITSSKDGVARVWKL